MFRGKWLWIIIALIIIVLLGLVLHYFQDRHSDHFRVNRPPMVEKNITVPSAAGGREDSGPGVGTKVQRMWQNFWTKTKSRLAPSKPETQNQSPAPSPPAPGTAPSSVSSAQAAASAAPAEQTPAPAIPAAAVSKSKQHPTQEHKNSVAANPKTPVVKIGPLPHIAQYSRKGSHAAHPVRAGKDGQAVKTFLIQDHMLGVLVDSVGSLRAVRDISVAPQIAGNIASINYKPGTVVQSGTLLFTLDSRVYKANLEKAQSELALSKSDYERYTPLAEKGLVPKQQLEQVKEKYHADLAEVKVNKAYLDQTQLTAPFTGSVGAKNVSVGDYVTAGQQVTRLVDRNNLLVNFLIPAEYLSRLENGQQVIVTVPQQGDPSFVGQVNYIAPEVDDKTHSITVQASIDNKTLDLTPGLFVRVKLKIDAGEQALLVPQNAVILQNNKHVVYVVENGRAYSKAVITGKIIGDKISITTGLSAGDSVVVVGQQQLRNGMMVHEVKS